MPRHALIIETIRDVAGGSLSEYEVLFLRMCQTFGLPKPTRQRRRKDASGRWRYLDVDFDECDWSSRSMASSTWKPFPGGKT